MSDSPSPRKAPWKWLWAVGVAVALGLGLVLLFLLTLAADNQALYERNYDALLLLNALVAAVLLLVIVWTFSRLVVRWRRGKFGSRLLAKLAMIFALVGMLPGVLIYGVSYQFVSRSIESWFDVQVEGALEAGLNLGRTSLDTLASDLSSKARVAAGQLSDTPSASAGLALSACAINGVRMTSFCGALLANHWPAPAPRCFNSTPSARPAPNCGNCAARA